MNNILKMIHFDYCISEKQMHSGFLLMIAAVLLGMLLNPMFSVLMIPFAAMSFLFGRESTGKPGFRRLYGILPVQRSSITRASFIEYFCTSFIGEMLSLLAAGVSVLCKLYLHIKGFLNSSADDLTADAPTAEDIGWMLFQFLVIFMIVCLFLCLFQLLSGIFGQENEIRIVLGMLLAAGAVGIPLLTMLVSGKIVIPDFAWMHPEHIGGRLLLFLAVNLLTAGLCTLFCEIAVRAYEKREL